MSDITVGSRVRSFDFDHRELDGPRACYIEGVVEAIGEFGEFPDCPRYKIKADLRVFGGELCEPGAEHFYPPVNGTPKLFGGTCDGVELADAM